MGVVKLNIFIFTITVLFLSVISGKKVDACTSIAAGKKASSTGRVLLGHNEDDNGMCMVLKHVVAPSEHRHGGTFSFEDNRADLPEPAHTLGYIWSQICSIPGSSGADCFYNERGVSVVSDNCSESRTDNKPELSDGGIVYGLRHLVACQATSARHGVDIASDLLETYGYGDSGRCYIIADKDEAWMLQTIKGRHYCAKRVGDDQVAFIPNHYTIREIDPDAPDTILSSGFVEHALKNNWHKDSSGLLDFAKTVQDGKSWLKEVNTFRHRNALRVITGTEWGEEDSLPFSVKPKEKMTVDRIKSILRSHYEGTGDDIREKSDRSPHFTKIRRICTGTTLESTVVQFRDNPALSTIWTAQGHPCSSPFVPWYGGILGTPQEFVLESPDLMLKKHFKLKPQDMQYDKTSPWWRVQNFQCLLDGQYDDAISRIRDHIKEIEKRWKLEDMATVEKAKTILKEAPESARLFLTGQTSKKMREAMGMTDYLYDKVLPRVEISADTRVIEIINPSDELEISVKTDEEPVEMSFIFGQAMQKNETWAIPVEQSLTKQDNSTWTIRFRTKDITEICIPCNSCFWLYGKSKSGSLITGKIILNIIP